MRESASALLTDLYQLTMLQAYFDRDMDGVATFELFSRDLPAGRNFLLAAGLEPDAAAQQIVDTLGERVGSEGGCIMLDREGRVGWAHNSPDMSCAYRTDAMDAPFVATRKAWGE